MKPLARRAVAEYRAAKDAGLLTTRGGHREINTAIWINPDAKKEHPKDKEYRRWQAKAHEALVNERLALVNAPTGSGKSKLMRGMAAQHAQEGYKVIITYPQKIIGSSFSSDHEILHKGQTLVWRPQYVQKGEPTKHDLLRFLYAPKGRAPAMFRCTHSLLVRAFEDVKKRKRLDVFKDVSLFIDETHHVQAVRRGK